MKTAEASATSETLDALQVARGRVPLREWRLHGDCEECLRLSLLPATATAIGLISRHALSAHAEEIET